jgi:hypothetical protein
VKVLMAMATALGLWLACSGGLKVDEGNAFPCDFRKPEEERDLQCPPAWKCGIDGRCHDGKEEASPLGDEPVFQGERRFPRLLDGTTRFIAVDPRFIPPEENSPGPGEPAEVLPEPGFVIGYEDGGTYVTVGPQSARLSPTAQAQSVALLGERIVWLEEPAVTPQLKLYTLDPQVGLGSPTPVRAGLQPLAGVRALRLPTPSLDGGPRPSLVVLRGDEQAGEVELDGATYRPFPVGFYTLPDGGLQGCGPPGPVACPPESTAARYKDVRLVAKLSMVLPLPGQDLAPLAAEPVPVAVTSTSFLWRSQPPDDKMPYGEWRLLNPTEALSTEGPPPDGGMPGGGAPRQDPWLMRHNMMGGLWAVQRPMSVPRGNRVVQQNVLSTWALKRSPQRPEEPHLERAWDDCSPCGEGRLVTFTPVSDGALGVEVLCESQSGTRAMFRVVGSSVVSPVETCLRQPLEAPFDLSELPSVRSGTEVRFKPGAVDEARGAGLVLGGAHGQFWRGESLSRLKPGFLDRTPLAVVPFEVFPGQQMLLALSRDFISVGPFDFEIPGAPRGEGLWVTVPGPDVEEGGPSEGPRIGNVVEGVQGWFLLDEGRIFRVKFAEGEVPEPSEAYGPQLLGPSGEPAVGPYLGQGVPMDGGVALVLAANDQLYYREVPLSELSQEEGQAGVLTPRLTPEANFPVRSLALDRTVSLTAKTGPRVRGWVATSRSVFEFEQDAETEAWKLEQLPLGGGEPVEVWTREAESTSYGRLGLRDGQVLRLPQGLPITQPLPDRDQRVVDYASLAGWPIALGERGIYRTVPTTLSGGEVGLMRWEPLPPPPGLTAAGLEDAVKEARIAVVKEEGREVLYLFTRTGFVYRLGEGAR